MIENKIDIIKKVIDKKVYVCEYCSKEYDKSNSKWYHEKRCKIQYDKFIEKSNHSKNNDMEEIKQEISKLNDKIYNQEEEIQTLNEKLENQEDEVKTLNEKIENVKPIVFNLQVFLNEDCKNAISFNELLKQLQFHFDPSKTLTEDTSSTLLKTLTQMSLYERPIHCVDLKRHKLYIKDNDAWTKDEKVLNKIPKYVYTEYKNHVNEWTEDNPDFLENEQKLDVYITFTAKEVEDINIEKIKRNISKVTTIPKKEIKNE